MTAILNLFGKILIHFKLDYYIIL